MPHAAASKTDHRDAGVFLMLFIVFTFQCLKKPQIHSPCYGIKPLPARGATLLPPAAATHCGQTAPLAPAAHGSKSQSSPARVPLARSAPKPFETPAEPVRRHFRTRPPTHCLPTISARHLTHAGHTPKKPCPQREAPVTQKARPRPHPETSKTHQWSATQALSARNLLQAAPALPNNSGGTPRKSAYREPSRNEKQDCPR